MAAAPVVPAARGSPRKKGAPEAALASLLLFAAGCVSYRPEPLDPQAILEELRGVELFASGDRRLPGRQSAGGDRGAGEKAVAGDQRGRSEGQKRRAGGQEAGGENRGEDHPEPTFDLPELAAIAVVRNPSLRAVRAEAGVAEAALVEAGLLPDPEIGFDAMDAAAARWIEGDAGTVDFVSGFGFDWRVPRPGEIDARKGIARAHLGEQRARILTAEWSLVRQVALAVLSVRAARARLDQMHALAQISRDTAEFFTRARTLGGATALQANLAAVEVTALEVQQARLEVEEVQANQRLNALLGLPPQVRVPIRAVEDPFSVPREDRVPEELVDRAIESRPDLRELQERYLQSEEELRLEVVRQWPEMTLGTGFRLVLPILTRFHRPAIRTAMARRETARRRFEAAIHKVRAEIYGALAESERARRQVESYEEKLKPRLEESLRLTGQAFASREITLVEILTAQRQVLEAQQRHLEAKIDLARASVREKAATGVLVVKPAPAERVQAEED